MARTEAEWSKRPRLNPRDYVSTLVYTDPDIFAQEREKIHRAVWKFACHESELPNANDFRTLDHAGTQLVVARGADGAIRAFVNSCSHRGALVVRAAAGNAAHWTCLFHHWMYDTSGACVAIPRDQAYEESGVCKAGRGLRAVRTAVKLGMVFVNLDDTAPAFDDYVGDAFEQLAPVMGAEPLEVIQLYRNVVNANWKLLQEVQMELYHENLHFVNRQVAMGAPGYFARKWKIYPNAHGTLEPMQQKYEAIEGWERRTEKTLPGLKPGEFRIVDLFPDTCIIVRTTVMRIDTMVPLGPDRTLLESRGLGIKGESAEDRALRTKHHNQYWGPFGRNYAEDVIAPEAVHRAIREGGTPYGLFARHEDERGQDDVLVRSFYAEWSRRLGIAANDPRARTVRAAE
jgi:methanesulfonate monooxygenase large subunit